MKTEVKEVLKILEKCQKWAKEDAENNQSEHYSSGDYFRGTAIGYELSIKTIKEVFNIE